MFTCIGRLSKGIKFCFEVTDYYYWNIELLKLPSTEVYSWYVLNTHVSSQRNIPFFEVSDYPAANETYSTPFLEHTKA